MGCDIHVLLQTGFGEGWETREWLPDLIEDRSYATFGVLAGVRDTFVRPIAAPRGLPADLEGVERDSYGSVYVADKWLGDHSHSWLLVSEIALAELPEYTTIPHWLPRLLALGDPLRVRIVFGFDN